MLGLTDQEADAPKICLKASRNALSIPLSTSSAEIPPPPYKTPSKRKHDEISGDVDAGTSFLIQVCVI